MMCFGVFNCVLKVKDITYNDIHVLVNPMYLNIAVLLPAGASEQGSVIGSVHIYI